MRAEFMPEQDGFIVYSECVALKISAVFALLSAMLMPQMIPFAWEMLK